MHPAMVIILINDACSLYGSGNFGYTKMVTGSRVADTFADRSIFVTGASGFLGKVLVEKLLYSVPDIKKIYVLIRPLKGHSPRDRLDKLLQVSNYTET